MREALHLTGCEQLVLIIGNLKPGRHHGFPVETTLNAFLHRRDAAYTGTECTWVSLPGVSPIRREYEAVRAARSAPWSPWKLRPAALTVPELRRRETASRVTAAPGEPFWYLRPEGQQRLRDERQAFDRRAIAVAIERDSDRRLIIHARLKPGQIRYVLPERYPEEPPEVAWISPGGEVWALDLRARIGTGWDGTRMLLADVHRRLAQAGAAGLLPLAEAVPSNDAAAGPTREEAFLVGPRGEPAGRKPRSENNVNRHGWRAQLLRWFCRRTPPPGREPR